MNDTDIQELRGKFRGELITPADAAYDGARKVYNAMIDKRPALIARCADVADVDGGRQLRPREGAAPGRARRRPQRPRPRRLRRRARHRPVAAQGDPRRPEGAHGPRRGRVPLGRRGPCDPPLRPRGAQRLPLDDGRGRPDPGGRHRLPRPQVRPHHRQPPRAWTWFSPTAAWSPPATTRTPISSGPCAAAAATSASSPRSSSGAAPWAPSTAGRSSGPWTRRPSCSASGGTSSSRRPRTSTAGSAS